MAKANIIIDGAGVTATFGSAIEDINSISFSNYGERKEIDLTTVDETAYKIGLLSDLVAGQDIVINKKFDPAAALAMSTANTALVITYKVGKSTTKTATIWAQLKSISPGLVERAPADGINVDYTFITTNLNSALVETGPSIA